MTSWGTFDQTRAMQLSRWTCGAQYAANENFRLSLTEEDAETRKLPGKRFLQALKDVFIQA